LANNRVHIWSALILENIGKASNPFWGFFGRFRFVSGTAVASFCNFSACSGVMEMNMKTIMVLLLWAILLVMCWPLALMFLFIWPFLWLLSIPFRIVATVMEALLRLMRAILFLPARLLG
jgi:hypothetical protein